MGQAVAHDRLERLRQIARQRSRSNAISLSSRLRWSRLEKTSPSWMRLTSGTANVPPRGPKTSSAKAWHEWPAMNGGLELLADSFAARQNPPTCARQNPPGG
jgi:hypothetical protein